MSTEKLTIKECIKHNKNTLLKYLGKSENQLMSLKKLEDFSKSGVDLGVQPSEFKIESPDMVKWIKVLTQIFTSEEECLQIYKSPKYTELKQLDLRGHDNWVFRPDGIEIVLQYGRVMDKNPHLEVGNKETIVRDVLQTKHFNSKTVILMRPDHIMLVTNMLDSLRDSTKLGFNAFVGRDFIADNNNTAKDYNKPAILSGRQGADHVNTVKRNLK